MKDRFAIASREGRGSGPTVDALRWRSVRQIIEDYLSRQEGARRR